MNRYEMINSMVNELSPIPENIPKIYFLGDTGTGKTTIIRKILGTDEYNFPTTRQRRTTVATTEYVLSKNLPYKATIIIKTENEISGYINEILQEGAFKLLNENTIIDENSFKTQEQFLQEFDKVAQRKGIPKGEDYNKLYWEAFERYSISSLREF